MNVLFESVIHSLFQLFLVSNSALIPFFIHERNVHTVHLVVPMQMEYFLREGVHCWQITRWLPGRNTIETSLFRNTFQGNSSCNLQTCSSNNKVGKFLLEYTSYSFLQRSFHILWSHFSSDSFWRCWWQHCLWLKLLIISLVCKGICVFCLIISCSCFAISLASRLSRIGRTHVNCRKRAILFFWINGKSSDANCAVCLSFSSFRFSIKKYSHNIINGPIVLPDDQDELCFIRLLLKPNSKASLTTGVFIMTTFSELSPCPKCTVKREGHCFLLLECLKWTTGDEEDEGI